jgi:hypothetical protein
MGLNKTVGSPASKLLKEKGFDLPTNGFYYSEEFKTEDIKFSDNINHNSHISKFSAPTITEVIMWLYKKHKIWISVYQHKDHAADVNDKPTFRTNFTHSEDFNSPTEAYEVSILRILKYLI